MIPLTEINHINFDSVPIYSIEGNNNTKKYLIIFLSFIVATIVVYNIEMSKYNTNEEII